MFYLEKKMHDLRKDLTHYHYLHNSCKNFKYFENKKYPVSEKDEKQILSEEAKLKRIQGFLLFANPYIGGISGSDHYRAGLDFYRAEIHWIIY